MLAAPQIGGLDMKLNIVLYLSSKKREQDFHRAMLTGFSKLGDRVSYMPKQTFDLSDLPADTDVLVIVGVKSKRVFQACQAKGITVLMVDKGYFRNREYYRFSLGGYQPPYLEEMKCTPERMRRLGVRLRPHQSGGSTVIFAGSSHKYCAFHELGDVNQYARNACTTLNTLIHGEKTLIYRPKPSWWANDAKSEKRIAPDTDNLPANTRFSGPNELLSQLLPDCHCLVTHGSTAALDALAAGVPVLLLSDKGVSPAWPLSELDMRKVLNPFWPDDQFRQQIFANLAHCQFNLAEMADGTAWANLKPWYKKV